MPVKRDLSGYFQDIQAATANPQATRKSYKVENAFTPTYKDGKFSVVIRFLPSHPDEIKPFVENRTHMFKVNGDQWFGCDCLGKFGKPCPICEYNREQFKNYPKEEARQHSFGKARSKYVTNILVVRNPNAPDTEGKVYRFEFGAQIMKLISEAMTEHDDGLSVTPAINPFDWTAGANFVYEGIQSSNGPKLDASHFGPQQRINKFTGKGYTELTDDEIDEIESKLYKLEECYHKESDVADYNKILERYEKKTGKTLFEGMPASGTSAANANPFAADAPAEKPAESTVVTDTFDFDAPAEPKAAPKAKKATPAPATDSLDDTAFWAEVNKNQG